MEDKKTRQEIDINKFINLMEHPSKDEVKKDIESAIKSKYIPDEIKEQIKNKFCNIDDNDKIGEEYDRYLINLLNKKRKDFKYLQAIFIILNNAQKHKILEKEGIIREIIIEDKNSLQGDEEWYIDIQMDIIFNDNNYYHKYIKKILNEIFQILNKEFFAEYIKLDYNKKGESYYKNNKEVFLSSVISLFEKLNDLTKDVDKNQPKRKKKNKKKNKNNNIIDSTNIPVNNNEIAIKDNNSSNRTIKEENDKLNIEQNIINDTNKLNDKKEEKKYNSKLEKINKGELTKNKIWLNNLELNREELKLVKNTNDESLKNKNTVIDKLQIPDINIISKIDIEKKILDLENQINELKSKNKIQSSQISECKVEISKLKQDNENLKSDLDNTKQFTDIFLRKKFCNSIMRKIINKYNDKIKIEKDGENIKINFIKDINDISTSDLNKFIETINCNFNGDSNKANYIFKNMMKYYYKNDNNFKLYENLTEKLFTKEEMKEMLLPEEDIKIEKIINEKLNKK